MAVVGQLQVGVEPHEDGELEAGVRGDVHLHPGREAGGQLDAELLLAGETEGGGGLALQVLERDDAHPHQVTPVDPLVTLGNDGPDAQQERSLGCPVTTGAAAVVLPGQNDEVRPGLGVLLGGVEDVQNGSGGDVDRLGSRLPDELVDQPDVAEGAPGHHGVVPSPGAEAVELPGREALAVQEPGGRGLPGDGPGGGDVVRRDGVAKVQQGVRLPDGRFDGQLRGHPLEERRTLDVGGGWVPGVEN